jgi:hypothetical protein
MTSYAFDQYQDITIATDGGLERSNMNLVDFLGNGDTLDMDRSGYNSIFLGGTDQTVWLNLCTPNAFYASAAASGTAFEVAEMAGAATMTIYDWQSDVGGSVALMAGQTATEAPYTSQMSNGYTWGEEVSVNAGYAITKLDFAYYTGKVAITQAAQAA